MLILIFQEYHLRLDSLTESNFICGVHLLSINSFLRLKIFSFIFSDINKFVYMSNFTFFVILKQLV